MSGLRQGGRAALQLQATQLCPCKGRLIARGRLHQALTPRPETSPVGDAARGTHQSHRKRVLRTHQLSAPMEPIPRQASRQPTQVGSGTTGRDKHPVPRTTAGDGSSPGSLPEPARPHAAASRLSARRAACVMAPVKRAGKLQGAAAPLSQMSGGGGAAEEVFSSRRHLPRCFQLRQMLR